MKCFNCGKNFDYEKYYGICPKCGCFNKNEASQVETKEKGGIKYTIFLIISLVCFLVVSVGGTAFRLNYRERLRDELEQELLETEILYEEHKLGESFSYQGLTLTFTETRVWDEEELSPGKKLIAVKLVGERKGPEGNQVFIPYIKCKDLYYCPIQEFMLDDSVEQYGISLFDEYALCSKAYEEGWCLFLVDEWEKEFTLHLEEWSGGTEFFIQTIHSIEIQLGEDELSE